MKSFICHGKKFKSYLIALRDQAEKEVAHKLLLLRDLVKNCKLWVFVKGERSKTTVQEEETENC